jgi:hypothetical protein
MKLSENTLAILQSFSNINKSILIKSGNIVKTKPELTDSPTVKAKIDETFPVDFAIYEFKKFLQIISLFDDPELDFKDTHVEIKDKNNKKSTIYYDDPRYVSGADYDKNLKLPSVDVSFEVDYDTIQSVIKSSKTLGHSEICFRGEDDKLYVSSFEKRQKDNFSIQIGETDKKFTMIFSISDFSIMKTKYDVELCFKGIAKLESQNLTYWIAPLSKSTYS